MLAQNNENILELKKELELNNKKIKTLQNKIDYQDLLINNKFKKNN